MSGKYGRNTSRSLSGSQRPTGWMAAGVSIKASSSHARLVISALISSTVPPVEPYTTRPSQTGPGYRVTFAEQIRQATSVLTGAVGMIIDPHQANTIIDEGSADAALMAREFLWHLHWPLLAASELGADTQWPLQYQEARRANIRLGTSRMSEDWRCHCRSNCHMVSGGIG